MTGLEARVDAVRVASVYQSPDIAELSMALVQFQAAVTGAKKGGKNPHFRNSYTRLEDAWAAAREHLTDAGLAVVQWPGLRDGCVEITTRIVHKSGQWMQSSLAIPLDTAGSKNVAQQVGSTITYGSRYSFLCALGLPPTDDDGEAAAPRRKPAVDVARYVERIEHCKTEGALIALGAEIKKLDLDDSARARLADEFRARKQVLSCKHEEREPMEDGRVCCASCGEILA